MPIFLEVLEDESKFRSEIRVTIGSPSHMWRFHADLDPLWCHIPSPEVLDGILKKVSADIMHRIVMQHEAWEIAVKEALSELNRIRPPLLRWAYSRRVPWVYLGDVKQIQYEEFNQRLLYVVHTSIYRRLVRWTCGNNLRAIAAMRPYVERASNESKDPVSRSPLELSQ